MRIKGKVYQVNNSVTFSNFSQGWKLDCKDIKEGSKLYLNCFHDGALLFLGDVHASQGDTEWSCSANEVKAEVTLSCKVIKNKKIPYARIEREESIIQLFADKPSENAVYKAVINLMSWMVEEYGARPKDAYIKFTRWLKVQTSFML